MHKKLGIQLGLTESLRCQLPQGTDGTGYWELTVYALGYEDTTFQVQATEANIVKPTEETGDTTELAKTVKAAQSLNEADYCATSWKNLKTELGEAEEELANPNTQAVVDEAKEHLQAAIDSLQKHSFGKEYVKTAATTSSAGQMAKKCEKCGVEVLGSTIPKLEGTANTGTNQNNTSTATTKTIKLKTTTAKLSTVKKTSMKVSWKKISGASGYQVQYSTSSKFKKTVTVKVSSKKTAATITKLKKNKKYYVRVRGYKKASGKTTYSSWSKAVSKTTKK
jgi:molybdopterin converting factor small subunit